MDLGVVEYSNIEVAGLYDCSVHYMYDNYIYIQLKNVTEAESKIKERTSLSAKKKLS